MNSNSPRNSPTASPVRLPEGDPGYFYDREVVAGQHGEIRLSPGVEAHCRCGGLSPYQVFERPDAEPTWCPCRPYRTRIRQIGRLLSDSGIPERFRYKFWDDFHETAPDGRPIPGASLLKGQVSTQIDRYAAARRRTGAPGPRPGSRSSHDQPKGFFLWGVPGNGKTLLACIALNELIFNCVQPGKFIGLSRKFFQTLRHTFDQESPIHGQAIPILETLSRVPFLAIDDFGVQRDTEWEVEMLYNLVDARYADQRLTFVTTNKSIEEVKDLAEGRIYSRFLEMCYIIHVQAPDYRHYSRKEYEI